MAQVLSKLQLHVDAAKGFLKTGIRVPLDGSKDVEICREAHHLWVDGGLRQKVDDAVADVREECRQKRLKWSFNDVFKLVQPYEANRAADRVLQALGEENLDRGDGHVENAQQFADDFDLDSHASEMEGWEEAVEDVVVDSDGEGCRIEAGDGAGAAVAAEDGHPSGRQACLMDGLVDAQTAEQIAAAT